MKCRVCGNEIGGTSKPNFAEQYINENPGHLEYRIIVEMLAPSVPDHRPIFNAPNVTQQASVESQWIP